MIKANKGRACPSHGDISCCNMPRSSAEVRCKKSILEQRYEAGSLKALYVSYYL